jgi:nucleoside-diphosphate-sugar epimerase
MPTIAITGAHSDLGRAVGAAAIERGADVVAISSAPGPGERRFVLGAESAPALLDGVDVLVHAAWDQSVVGEAEMRRVNVDGSLALLKLASASAVRVVFVSSLAAAAARPAAYGRAKLAVEAALGPRDASIRPGLLFGPGTGGMYGSLVGQVTKGVVVPVIRSRGVLQLGHVADVASLLADVALGAAPAEQVPIVAAHPAAHSLGDVVRVIASAHDRRVWRAPVPWRAVYAGLRLAEATGARLPFRADSVASMAGSSRVAVPAWVAERMRPFDAATARDPR